KRIDFRNRRGFVYVFSAKTVTIYPNLSAIESPDSSYSLISWDINKTLIELNDSQHNNQLNNLLNKIQILLAGQDVPLYYSWDREQHQEILESNFSDLLNDKQESIFIFTEDGLEILPEQIGQTFDYHLAMSRTEEMIEDLMSEDIKLDIIEDRPEINSAVLESFRDQIINISNRGDLSLSYEESNWMIDNEIWRDWLKLEGNGLEHYDLKIDKDFFVEYLESFGIKEDLEVPVQDAKFKLVDSRPAEFMHSQNGLTINIDNSLELINNALITSGELEVALVVEVVEPNVANQDVNDLGIVELIGTGESNFRGSPVNRVHNIGVGADTLQGVLIAPDEEFSLMTTLGEIDGASGYRQELVIKGNETIPEYGGGLCQIGTTVFRAALRSGLPITQRRNHSYRVSYYEPAGMDATIYSPWPDLKFKNDTGRHILVQARIEGTQLYFDFWGTRDGREIILTEPVIYNIVSPPEEKIIKTTDLEPGQRKCTESAHNGADAKFDYSVQYPGQAEPVEETFHSHYVPWQKVCLLGVTEEELLAEQEAEENATTTPSE
ncbi:VanW family protein, partial [bacterium]|nr:VanW family protein [bacterium]